MKFKIKKAEHYKVIVTEHSKMDELRKTQCLCLNCDYMPCKDSQKLFKVCLAANIALAVTRCKNWSKPSIVDGVCTEN